MLNRGFAKSGRNLRRGCNFRMFRKRMLGQVRLKQTDITRGMTGTFKTKFRPDLAGGLPG